MTAGFEKSLLSGSSELYAMIPRSRAASSMLRLITGSSVAVIIMSGSISDTKSAPVILSSLYEISFDLAHSPYLIAGALAYDVYCTVLLEQLPDPLLGLAASPTTSTVLPAQPEVDYHRSGGLEFLFMRIRNACICRMRCPVRDPFAAWHDTHRMRGGSTAVPTQQGRAPSVPAGMLYA